MTSEFDFWTENDGPRGVEFHAHCRLCNGRVKVWIDRSAIPDDGTLFLRLPKDIERWQREHSCLPIDIINTNAAIPVRWMPDDRWKVSCTACEWQATFRLERDAHRARREHQNDHVNGRARRAIETPPHFDTTEEADAWALLVRGL